MTRVSGREWGILDEMKKTNTGIRFNWNENNSNHNAEKYDI